MSERPWHDLQEEMQSLREIGRGDEMCDVNITLYTLRIRRTVVPLTFQTMVSLRTSLPAVFHSEDVCIYFSDCLATNNLSWMQPTTFSLWIYREVFIFTQTHQPFILPCFSSWCCFTEGPSLFSCLHRGVHAKSLSYTSDILSLKTFWTLTDR